MVANLHLWLLVILLALIQTIDCRNNTNPNRCGDVKALNIGEVSVPSRMAAGEHLEFCPRNRSCCTTEIEQVLHNKSMAEYRILFVEKVGTVQSSFAGMATSFDHYFTNLLDTARIELHDMFLRTYGLLYEQNSFVFTNLFDDLRNYYKGANMNLQETFDSFFTTLLQKLFELLHAQSLDEQYVSCLSEHMVSLKPFGDIPERLSLQVRRSFVATRSFTQGLMTGRDVATELLRLQPDMECSKSMTRLRYCATCVNQAAVVPCLSYCHAVLDACVASYASLAEPWLHYMEAMNKLAERLEGSFNIEAVVEPMDIKISEAIMNFQENSDTISEKIKSGCGDPLALGRRKRAVEQPLPGGGGQQQVPSRRRQSSTTTTTTSTTPAPPLDLAALVQDIRTQITTYTNLWHMVSRAICSDEYEKPGVDDETCWNGQKRGRYESSVNKTIKVEVTPETSALLLHASSRLIQTTTRLQSAYKGVDIDFVDDSDNSEANDDDTSASGQEWSGDQEEILEDSDIHNPHYTTTTISHIPSSSTILVHRQPTAAVGSTTTLSSQCSLWSVLFLLVPVALLQLF